MKKLLLPLVLAGAAYTSNASAVDVGLGVGLLDNGTTVAGTDVTAGRPIYIPIELNSDMRLEPFLSYNSSDFGDFETSTAQIGAGFFGKMKTGTATQMYFGGRLGLITFESTTTVDVPIFFGGTQIGTTTQSVKTDGSGFRLAPTAGLEYNFDSKFSVAGEVALYYEDIEEYSAMGTTAQVVLRYRY